VNKVAQTAGMACLGSAEARARVLRALASTDESEVQIAQAYLRHHPIGDTAELRKVARDVTRMKGTGAQVRALATLARQRIADREIIDELTRLFARTGSLEVQRAVAEVFIRGDARALPGAELAVLLRQHRLRAPGGGSDLIDVLIARLSI
jgi:HEAT repeat protein